MGKSVDKGGGVYRSLGGMNILEDFYGFERLTDYL